MAARSGTTKDNGQAVRPKGPRPTTKPKTTTTTPEPKTRTPRTAKTGANETAAKALVTHLRRTKVIDGPRSEFVAAALVTNAAAMDAALADRNGYWLRQASVTVRELLTDLAADNDPADPINVLLASISGGPTHT